MRRQESIASVWDTFPKRFILGKAVNNEGREKFACIGLNTSMAPLKGQ